jgi:hypothetical protein
VLDAQADTKAAVAAATYYLALYNYAYQTGDSDAFEVMSESGCLFCNDVIEDVASERAARQHAEGGDFHVVSSSALRLRPDFFTATLQVVQDPLQTLSPTGAVVDSKPTAAPYLIQFALDHGREGWSVKEVSVQAAPGAK